MPGVEVVCPACGAGSPAPREAVVRCGVAVCACTCRDCGGGFEAELEWWRWAGLDEAPPAT